MCNDFLYLLIHFVESMNKPTDWLGHSFHILSSNTRQGGYRKTLPQYLIAICGVEIPEQ